MSAAPRVEVSGLDARVLGYVVDDGFFDGYVVVDEGCSFLGA